MAYDTIAYAVADGVATIRLDRPDRMNALNAAMRRELVDALSRAPEEARALVLTGNGPGFCAGPDLGDMQRQAEAGRSRDFMEGVLAFLEKRSPRFEGR